MDFYIDYKTSRKFAVLLRNIPESVKEISASVAYTQDDILIKECTKKKIQLKWWGLFNSDISTKIEIVKEAIKSPYIKFFPFANFFHPKLIYLHGYGVYIGSHNITYNALMNNIEAGIFIQEEELNNEQKKIILDYFLYLEKNSIQATLEDLELMEQYILETKIENENIKKISQNLENLFEERFNHLFILKPGVQDFGKKNKSKEQKTIFLQEWRETQNYLLLIHNKILEKKMPEWIDKNSDISIITDQFLHAYYYTYLLKNKRENKNSIELVNLRYEENRYNPEKAVEYALKWWENLESPINNEDTHINIWNKTNKSILQNLKKRELAREELITVFKQNHAARNHARQIKNTVFNLPPDFKTNIDERVILYVDWIMKQKTKEKLTIQEVIKYLLFDDSIPLEERVFNTIYNERYKLEHFGRSIVGELIGWGRPEITHLRNNRVNKSLRALGFNVALFSD